MRLALALGRRRLGQAWPNPSVGCILVKDGRVIGRGFTGPGGRPHAEAAALSQAGRAARGSTAYVTLEPCAHFGQTPPCARLLTDAGIARAVIAVTDPDHRVSGRGIEILESAGIDVWTGILEEEARWSHRGFFSRIGKGLPSVTLKLAMSFDGRIATQAGDSRWITGPAARRRSHLMRARHDAVMVGRGTAAADNPDLSPRGLGIKAPPVRIVIDSRLSTPERSRLGDAAGRDPVWLCHGDSAPPEAAEKWRDLGATTICCRTSGGGLDLRDALGKLALRGLTRVFCEGGSALATSLIQGDLVDEVVGFSAGAVLGADGLPPIKALGLERVADARRYRLRTVSRIADDVMHRWMRIPDAQS